jgi:anaerobic selenocysteine-containing dehydrogenase
LENLGYDPLPTYKEPPESPNSTPEIAKDFPYILTTGSRRLEFFHSEHRQIESLRKRRPYPIAELHPEIACCHKIADGDWIYISSPRGRIKMKAKVTEDIRKGVVNIDHGWWFPEKEGPDFGIWESNANILTADSPPYDPAFGSYQLRGLLCNIENVNINHHFADTVE